MYINTPNYKTPEPVSHAFYTKRFMEVTKSRHFMPDAKTHTDPTDGGLVHTMRTKAAYVEMERAVPVETCNIKSNSKNFWLLEMKSLRGFSLRESIVLCEKQS